MAVTETITYDFDKIVTRLLERSKDYRVPLKRFYVYLHGETVKLFPILGKKGGAIYRGMQWKWFADQYKRKDGTIVPAEGGKKKVRTGYSYRLKSGKYRTGAARDIFTRKMVGARKTYGDIVWGRLRHSGKRIKAKDWVMADSSQMRKAALGSLQVSTHEIVMSTPVNYAKYQNAMRPFMFLTPEDIDKVRQYIIEYLIEG